MRLTFYNSFRNPTIPPPERRLRSSGPADVQRDSYTIYGHDLTFTDSASAELIEKAKVSYIDTVLKDLDSRFDGFNSVRRASFDCIFKVLELPETELRTMARSLAEAYYNIPSHELFDQLKLFRTLAEVKKLSFATFGKMAKYILTRTSEEALKHLHFLVSIILVLPFVSADCERLFSKLGYVKSADRNRLGRDPE